MKKRETSGKNGEQYDAGGPDVDLGRLRSTLEKDFWCAETSCSGTVGAARGPRVLFWIACSACWVAQGMSGMVRLVDERLAFGGRKDTGARVIVCAFALGEAEVNNNATATFRVVEKVCRFDVTVKNMLGMHGGEGGKERAEIATDVRALEVAEVFSKILMAEIGKYCYDLVVVTEGGDEGTDGVGILQVVEEFEFV